MSDPNEDKIVCLHPEQTSVNVSRETIAQAITEAYWVTCSSHEWSWSQEAQVAMARYVLWAHQRLSAIDQCVSGSLPQPPSDTRKPEDNQ